MNSEIKERLKVYPNIRQCSIQVFSDRKDENKYSRILELTDENIEWCIKLQENHPYGVYFSVNPMEAGKRDKESLKFIQTRITDIDEGSKETQLELLKNAPLQPTFVNESVHGFHLFYLADYNLSVDEYIEGNQGLKDYYHGDQKVVKDVARVLRFPGFLHYKADPVMVTWRKDLSSGFFYKPSELFTAFPKIVEEVKKPEVIIKPVPQWSGSDDYRYKVNNLDTKEMMLNLSGTKWMNGEIISFRRYSNGEQIICNGKETGCWLDKDGFIGSGDHGGPTRVQWIERYLGRKLSKTERYELTKIIDHLYPHLAEKKIEKLDVKEKIYNPTKVPKLVKPDFTRGSKELDSHLGKMKKGQLVILLGETGAGKTTFATFMARKNKGCCYFVLEDKVENIASRYAMKRAGITVDQYNEGTRSEQQEQDYEQAYLSFKNRDILLVDIGKKIEIEQLIESIKELKSQGHELFFIDNLGFVIGNGDSEAAQTADISHKLVSLCLEENICVVLLHHFKKKGKALDQRDISQMRGSGKLGDDAFMVVEYIRDDTQTFLRVFKDRTRGNLKIYEIGYDRGEYYFMGVF